MLSKYLSPICSKPLYLFDNVSDVKICGMKTGIVYAFVFTVILGALFIRQKFGEQQTVISVKHYRWIFAALLILIWILVPWFVSNGNANQWLGYQDITDQLIKRGYTAQQAFQILQNIDSNNTTTIPGISSAASLILSAHENPSKNAQQTQQQIQQQNQQRTQLPDEQANLQTRQKIVPRT